MILLNNLTIDYYLEDYSLIDVIFKKKKLIFAN